MTNPEENSTKPARVRYAPSPTGLTHLAGARNALYNYLIARQTGGQFILRIEDTDTKRFTSEAEQDLIESLHWLGLQWDEGPDIGGPHAPYHQTKRKDIYLEYAQKLIKKGQAYYCFCTSDELQAERQSQQKLKKQPLYSGKCRNIPPAEAHDRVAAGEKHVIRFKMPKEGTTTIHDYLRGDISFENQYVDDFILIKSNGIAVYHLAAMVDDYLMGITHVFRGEEWLPTSPIHVHIYRAFGWQQPIWVHLSLFLSPTGKGKMSKRETEELRKLGKSVFIRDMIEMGYLPEAVINWTALMGWSYDDKTEFFTLQDLVEKFSITKLNASPAALDFNKLDYFNGLHIRALSPVVLAKRLKPIFDTAGYKTNEHTLQKIAPLIQPRLTKLTEAPDWVAFLFKDEVHPDPEDLIPKNMSVSEALVAAQGALRILNSLQEIKLETAEQPMRTLANDLGIKAGQLFSILRSATTAQKVSPPLFESMEILGRERTLQRMKQAISLLKSMAK
jgi:glutamyl-tRNA synthetase